MFGSLVVSLPSQFTGGALVTRHQGHTMTFDWSSSSTTTQWAAFYSDVEHEVLPVTSGHRFTLTYNLYHTLPACHPVSFNITTNPLHKELQAALKTPHFMREGGTLGFFCCYRYVECESDEFLKFGDAPFLKGEDMIIYRVAKSLGLSVQLKAISRNKGAIKDFVIPSFKHQVKEIQFPDDISLKDKAKLALMFGHVESAKNIRWCVWSKQRKVPLLSTAHYGNDATAMVYYQSAALLIEVPKFTSGRGVPVASVHAVLSCIDQVNEKVDGDSTNNITGIESVLFREQFKLKSEEEAVTERNEPMHMIPPAKKAKKKQP